MGFDGWSCSEVHALCSWSLRDPKTEQLTNLLKKTKETQREKPANEQVLDHSLVVVTTEPQKDSIKPRLCEHAHWGCFSQALPSVLSKGGELDKKTQIERDLRLDLEDQIV